MQFVYIGIDFAAITLLEIIATAFTLSCPRTRATWLINLVAICYGCLLVSAW
jgi:hypothetical protein